MENDKIDLYAISSSVEFLRQISYSSNSFLELSNKLASEIFKNDENKEYILKCYNEFFSLINDSGTKICIMASEGNYSLVGGGSIYDYIPNFDRVIGTSSGFYGAFYPDFNITILPLTEGFYERQMDSLSSYYGVDKLYITENVLDTIFLTYIHECLHAYISAVAKISESTSVALESVVEFKTILSSTAKLNNLRWAEPIAAHWEEMLAHLVSNRKYYNFIVDNRYQIEISKMVSDVCNEDYCSQIVGNIINCTTKFAFKTNSNIIQLVKNNRGEELFLSRKFYENHPKNILGIEKLTTNQYGREVYITQTNKKDGTISDILSRIEKLYIVDFAEVDNLLKVCEYGESVEITNIEEQFTDDVATETTETSEVQVISPNQKVVSFRQSVQLFNPKINRLEIEAYLFCYPTENKLMWIDEEKYSKDDILKSMSEITLNKGLDAESTLTVPTVIFDGEKYHYFANYTHGNLPEKIERLKNFQDAITEELGQEYYEKLIDGFFGNKEKGILGLASTRISFDNEAYADRPYLSPTSEIALSFKIKTYEGDDRNESEKSHKNLKLVQTFIESFKTGWYKSSKPHYKGIKYDTLIKVLKNIRIYDKPHTENVKDLTPTQIQENKDADVRNDIAVAEAFDVLIMVFSDFIKDMIDEESKLELTKILESFYDKFCFTDLNKIPIGFTHSAKFKRRKFELQPAQRDAVAFMNITHTGLLAYDIGVGKTIAAIVTMSNRLDTKNCYRPILVVPKQVYSNWIKEMQGNVDEIEEAKRTKKDIPAKENGCVEHLNIVKLGNMNDDIVYSLKEYSDMEQKKINESSKLGKKYDSEIVALMKQYTSEKEEDVDNEAEINELDDIEIEESKIKLKYAFKKFDLDTNLLDTTNKIFKSLPIDVFSAFGISDEENKDYDKIYKLLNFGYNQGNLPIFISEMYTKLGVNAKKEKSDDDDSAEAKKKRGVNFEDISNKIHYLVIINTIYRQVIALYSYYTATLGKLKTFKPNSIFVMTIQGLKRFGFKKETIDLMSEQFTNILQGNCEGLGYKKMLECRKSRELYVQKIRNIFARSIISAKVYFEDFGFDYLCVDEAHNMKNLITSVTKTGEEASEGEIKGVTSIVKGAPKPSDIALYGFLASMYIQMNNKGKNTMMLTATPFTNSPLEIYSMLTLVNYTFLEKMGFPSVKSFVDMFIKEKMQVASDASGGIAYKKEVVGFNNGKLLKRIIYTLMDYKTGYAAKVIRPCKINLPIREKTTLCDKTDTRAFEVIKPISTIVIPTKEQQFVFDGLQQYLISQYSANTVDKIFKKHILSSSENISKYLQVDDLDSYYEYQNQVEILAEKIKQTFNLVKNPRTKQFEVVEQISSNIALLKTLMAFRSVSITPYMFNPYVKDYLGITDIKDIDLGVAVLSSNKAMYTLGCIKALNNHFDKTKIERKGVVIYSNLGVSAGKNSPIKFLHVLRDYMLDEQNGFGYKKNSIVHSEYVKKKFSEVEVMSGKESDKVKRILIDLFNQNKVKCLITTVKEGVNLQTNTTCLFNISVDWNPTDAKQIEGRVWRQGNKNAYCVVGYPLTANSSDIFIYQKLQDKTAKLKAVWDSPNEKSQYDLEEYNPEEQKIEMISKVDKLAPFLYDIATAKQKIELQMYKARLEEDEKIIRDYNAVISKAYQLRSILQLATKYSVALSIALQLKEVNFKIGDITEDIRLINDDIELAKKESVENTEAYINLKKTDSDIAKITDIIEANKNTAGDLVFADAADADDKTKAKVKKDIDDLKKANKELTDKIAKIEKSKIALQKEVDAEIEKLTSKLESKKKEKEKELKQFVEKKEKLNVQYEERTKDTEIEIEFDKDNLFGYNYFAKSETDSKSIIYKKGVTSLTHIDWLGKATILDLLEGAVKVYDDFLEQKGISRPYYEKDDETIPLSDLKALNINIKDDVYKEMLNVSGDNYNLTTLSVTRMCVVWNPKKTWGNSILDESREFYALMRVWAKRKGLKKALVEYHSVVGDEDADAYIKGLQDKIYAFGDIDNGYAKISNDQLDKYLSEALTVIKEREVSYGSYIKLVDEFSVLKEVLEISMLGDNVAQTVEPIEDETEEVKTVVVKTTDEPEDNTEARARRLRLLKLKIQMKLKGKIKN